jgi:septum formation protein
MTITSWHSPVAEPSPLLVLASASPRRAALLASAGVEFEVVVADVDESPRPDEAPPHYVRRLAQDKAANVAGARADATVVAADTTVDVDGEILEKPIDEADLARMLRLLAGRAHRVHTGVAVAIHGVIESIVVTTVVTFVELSDADIEWYVATGDGFGKAGGYGIQGCAARFVERVDGSVTNVIGLPLVETLALLGDR